jgi:proteic killer suppression protein
MIVGFRHKGLKRLFQTGDGKGVSPDHAAKVARILGRLEEALQVGDMNLPGFRLHPLKGDLAGFWSVAVSGNWRVVFRFEDGNASDVDLIDYH